MASLPNQFQQKGLLTYAKASRTATVRSWRATKGPWVNGSPRWLGTDKLSGGRTSAILKLNSSKSHHRVGIRLKCEQRLVASVVDQKDGPYVDQTHHLP